MFGIPSLYLKIGGFLLLFGILTSGYFYIKYLNSELDAAHLAQTRLTETLANQEKVLNTLREDVQRMSEIQTDMFSRINNAELTTRQLSRRLQNDFSQTSLRGRNPSDVEREANVLMRETNRCNELVTGSPLTEQERNGQTTNSVCPELLRVR